MILAVDDDDVSAHDFLRYQKYPFLKWRLFQRSEYFTRDYINPLARAASGRWIMNLNDDTLFHTTHWDDVVLDRMKQAADAAGDDILLGLVDDGIIRRGEDPKFPHFSSWPIVSKQSVNLLGYMLNERFWIWGVDHFIANAYRRVNRLVSLTDVLIDHDSHHTKKRARNANDINFDRFRKIETLHGFNITPEMVEEEAEKIIAILKDIHGLDYSISKGALTVY